MLSLIITILLSINYDLPEKYTENDLIEILETETHYTIDDLDDTGI